MKVKIDNSFIVMNDKASAAFDLLWDALDFLPEEMVDDAEDILNCISDFIAYDDRI